jgi:methyl-accepting chemotaxis protein
MEEITQEQARKSVNAAFDSVNLINEINALTEKTEEDLDTLDRNIEHLNIMMAKDWFANELTIEQRQQIESVL